MSKSGEIMILADYDIILINSSAGKDSQAMLDYVHSLAVAEDVADRITVVHADLGRAEWSKTKELAAEQAAHYGARFEVVSRPPSQKALPGVSGDLLDHIKERGMFPSSSARYCTSDHKRGQVSKVITQLVTERRTGAVRPMLGFRPVKVLSCMGLRAEESPNRAKLPQLKRDARQTNGKRIVDVWLPIQDWSTDQVWARIRQAGTRYHPAYDLGMGRLSCVFCIFAPKQQLVLAGKHNPELLEQYVQVEREIGHTFKADLSLAQVQQEIADGAQGGAGEWGKAL
jgi:3'-phosphoadenosine 5'-phosphosulfate sulfotransferase (PAPS reductase)/FAD synthetase